MAVYSHPKSDICLFDVRENAIIRSFAKNCNKLCSNDTGDTIAIEESRSICVLDWFECFGFLGFYEY